MNVELYKWLYIIVMIILKEVTLMDKLQQCINLIEETYKTYNGQINPINKAGSLMIVTYESDMCAYMDRHNVIINVSTLLRKFENYIEEMTVEAVLHELSHFDQVIDFNRYMDDVEYRESIEHANTLNSLEYMMKNIDLINILLRTNISKSFIGSLYTQAVQSIYSEPYNRLGYNSLYGNTLKMFNGFHNIDYIIESVPNIDICISNHSTECNNIFDIKRNGCFNINTAEFNRFIYRNINLYKDISYVCNYRISNDNSFCQFEIDLKRKFINPIIIIKNKE
jgi:hypothetical protein